MSEVESGQILDALGQGVAALDGQAVVTYWNPWMERASGIAASDAVGKPILALYPGMDTPSLRRNFKSVMAFGITAYFSNRLHGSLFPFPPLPGSPDGFDRMQQNCTMGPLMRGDERIGAYVIVNDITETTFYQRKLVQLAVKDVLTTAYNRRYFDSRLVEETDRAKRYGHRLSLIMMDIDHFKDLNDLHGHPFGDEALRALVKACEAATRSTDIVARYGGEEFCVILPETGLGEAEAFAERLRAAVEGMTIAALGIETGMTVSLGVSELKGDEEGAAVLDRADRALYAAKANGRNRVEALS